MEKSSSEIPRVPLHNFPLPFRKLDLACVLAARPMLREQAWPVLRGTLDLGHADSADAEDAGRGHHRRHRALRRREEARPVVTARYVQCEYIPLPACQPSVAEVEAQEICVRGLVERSSRTARTV